MADDRETSLDAYLDLVNQELEKTLSDASDKLDMATSIVDTVTTPAVKAKYQKIVADATALVERVECAIMKRDTLKKALITDSEGREQHSLKSALEIYVPLTQKYLERALAGAAQDMQNAFALLPLVTRHEDKERYQLSFDRAKALAEHVKPLIVLRDRMRAVLLGKEVLSPELLATQ